MELFDELLDPARLRPGGPRPGGRSEERIAVSPTASLAPAPSIGTLEIDTAIRGSGERPAAETEAKQGDATVEDESAPGAAASIAGLAHSLIRAGFALLDGAGPIDGLDGSLRAQSIGETHLIRRMAIAAAVEAQRTMGPPSPCALTDERAGEACGHALCPACTPLAGTTSIEDAARVAGAAGPSIEQVIDQAGQTIAAENRLSARATKRRVERAVTLGAEYPVTFAAYSAGTVSRVHVEQIVRARPVIRLDEDTTHEDAARIMQAYDHGAAELAKTSTASTLPPKLALLANRLNPRTLQERHRDAVQERHVRIELRDDGMADLVIHAGVVLVQAAANRLADIARAFRKAGAEGTLGQLTADQAMTMLLTGVEQTPLVGETGDASSFVGLAGKITARVAITMPFTGLLAETEHLGDLPELEGKRPISHEVARAILGTADEVVRVVTHPLTGVTITADAYRATRTLRRFRGVRDVRCRWLGCARDGDDLDHTLDHQYGGKTTPENLEVLCRHHHTLKHAVAKTTGERLWKVRHLDDTGTGRLEWTTPNGVVLVDDPPRSPGVIFVPTQPVEQADIPAPF